MSTPENPLNRFRTYSYYFIFGVTNSVRAAERVAAMSDDPYRDLFTHSSKKFTPIEVGEGSWALLANGAKDTQFIIKSLKIESMLNPNSEFGDQTFFQTMNLEGNVVIQEPLGINFYNIMRQLSIDMDTSVTGMVFFIKPIFVGYDEGSGISEVESKVKPYLFYITDMTSVIDEGGATYDIQTLGMVNGAAKLTQFQSVSDGFSLKVPMNKSLVETFNLLDETLEAYSNDRRKAITVGAPEVGLSGVLDKGRPIRYQFDLDTEYQRPDFIVGTNVSPEFDWKVSQGEGSYYLAQGASAGIEDLIKQIMNSCQGVIEDRGLDAEGNPLDDKDLNSNETSRRHFVFKVLSSVDSTDKEFIITFHIRRYEVYFEEIGSNVFRDIPNKLEFDYIYTGKNIDIRKFDMRMNMGMAFFQYATSSDTINLDGNDNLKPVFGGGPVTGMKNAPQNDPQVLKKTIREQDMRDTANPVSMASYYAMLRKWSALESAGAILSIKGNPQLMDETVFMPVDLAGSGTTTLSNKILFSTEGADKSPINIKINIKFPKDYANPRAGFEQFWYDGTYYATQVVHVFEDGDFYQDLTLMVIPSNVYGEITAKDKGAVKVEPKRYTNYGAGAANPENWTNNTKESSTPKPTEESLPPEPPAPNLDANASTGGVGDDGSGGAEAASVRTNRISKSKKGHRLNAYQFSRVLDRKIKTLNSQIVEVEEKQKHYANMKARNAARGLDFEIPDITIPGLDDAKKTLAVVEGYVGKYKQYTEQVKGVVEKAQGVRSKVENVLNQDSTVGVINALDNEFKILEKLKITPDNLINIVKKKAPILTDTWKSLTSVYQEAQDQYQKLRGQYNQLKTLYGKLQNLKNLI